MLITVDKRQSREAGVGRGIDVYGLQWLGQLRDALQPVPEGGLDLLPVEDCPVAEGQFRAMWQSSRRNSRLKENKRF